MLMESLCLSELGGGDGTVEPLKLPVLQLLSCPSMLLTFVPILLAWPVIAWLPAKSGLPSPWEMTPNIVVVEIARPKNTISWEGSS